MKSTKLEQEKRVYQFFGTFYPALDGAKEEDS